MKKFVCLNKVKYLSAIFIIAAGITSCEKLIEIPDNPPQLIPTVLVFADSSSVMSAMAGIYNNFGVSTQQAILSGGTTLNTGLTGDELVPSSSANAVYNNAILSSNGVIGSLWSTAYTALYQVNACLENIPPVANLSAPLKKQLIAEIKVVRALYYFNLVNLYGPVPLITTTDYNATKSLPRASVDTIYAQIISDLTDARQNLTNTYPSAGRARPNLQVANALLAKVYLYKGNWQEAESLANMVISSGIYNLDTDPTNTDLTKRTDLNKIFLKGSNEAIWQLPALSEGNQTREAATFVPFATNVVPGNSLSASLVNAFEAGDLRLQKWTGRNLVTATTYYYPFKYKNTTATPTPLEDYMIIRLADMFLIRAEAAVRQSKIAPAMQDLNRIRNRARERAVGFDYSGPSDQASVINQIILERRREFFCEWGNRWFDMKRTGIIDAVMGVQKTWWKTTFSLYPVPLAEIANNPFLIQNPGYQ